MGGVNEENHFVKRKWDTSYEVGVLVQTSTRSNAQTSTRLTLKKKLKQHPKEKISSNAYT